MIHLPTGRLNMALQTKKKVLSSFFLSDMNMCACCVYVYDYHLILSLSLLLLVSKDRICHCCACMDVNACFFFTLAILCHSSDHVLSEKTLSSAGIFHFYQAFSQQTSLRKIYLIRYIYLKSLGK